ARADSACVHPQTTPIDRPLRLRLVSMSPVIDVEQLRTSATTHLMEGHAYGAGVSFFLIEYPPGRGNSLHRHPYAEVFIVQEGEALFTVGDSEAPARPAAWWWCRPATRTGSRRSAMARFG